MDLEAISEADTFIPNDVTEAADQQFAFRKTEKLVLHEVLQLEKSEKGQRRQ